MKTLFRSKVTLLIIYLIMAGVAAYLNFFSGTIDIPNLIVTAAMFFVVLILFVFAFRKFWTLDSMVDDFEDAAQEIRSDFKVNNNEILWRYYSGKDNLFSNRFLARRYAEYRTEIDRMEELSGDVYRCDIEDYINQDMVDAAVSKNVLNLISGTMTGLGILGTFIGLSIGLQHFNTGTADEISQSISPLIQGIKVAFYTSIYGMVFALIFSFIFRGKMEDLYEAMEHFLDAYKGCVLPDSQGEGFRQLLEFQKQQSDSLIAFATKFGSEVGDQIARIAGPQFDRMNNTIEQFAMVATKSQVEGLERVVTRFVEMMNISLGNSMQNLKNCIEETVVWQREDREYMRSILQEMGSMASDLVAMNEMSERTVDNVSVYVERIGQFQDAINRNMAALEDRMRDNTEIAAKQQSYLRNIASYEQRMAASYETVTAQSKESAELLKTLGEASVSAIQQSFDRFTEDSRAQLDVMGESAKRMSSSMERSAGKLTAASEQLGDKYSGTLSDTMESFERMQREIETMIYSVDSLRRNVNALKELKNN